MTTFAKDTTVAVEKTRNEIEQALARYGADAFGYAVDNAARRSNVQFRLKGRLMRFSVPMPDETDSAFKRQGGGPSGRQGSFSQEKYDQASRQRWRALLLYVKAALEAIENDLLTVDQAFLQAIVLPNGQTIGELAGHQVEGFVLRGETPALLPGGDR